jgi:hypothetical protein
MDEFGIAISSAIHGDALRHLLRQDGQEDVCFALWFPSDGTRRRTALIERLVLPVDGDRDVHGNVTFNPQFFERAIGEALAHGAGLALLHSHPWSGWQGMSDDDVDTEKGRAAQTLGATGLPLVGLTLATDGAWSGRFWVKTAPRTYERRWCRSVRVAGEALSVTYHDELAPPPRLRPELERTVSAWGPEIQANLARLRVGVVGAGSVGSIIGEALARMGVETIVLLDFDAVELINLDRLLHATRQDATRGSAKVDVLARALRESATAESFSVIPSEFGVTEEDGYRLALDCDVLFSCVDRPWPRSVLNAIAYAHLIPVVDGGVRAEPTPAARGLRRADVRAHTAAPGRRCLECLGQYAPELVSADRDGYFDRPDYIQNLPADHPARRNENVFAFALQAAALQLAQFISLVVQPLGQGNPGTVLYHLVTNGYEVVTSGCEPTCPFPGLIARGDRMGLSFTAKHPRAEEARARRASRRST